jgi:quinol monooxygenase YgiN
MSYTVLAWWRAAPGDGGEIGHLLAELARPSRTEPGCQVFEVHRNPDDPTDFFLYEVYEDLAAYHAHHASEHFQRLAVEKAIPRLAERRRQVYELVDIASDGNAGRGGP